MKLLCALFISLFIFSQTAQAKIYKWTDENGQIHFSDVKPQESINVIEPLSKINDVKSDVTTAEIKKFIIGTWQLPELNEVKDGVNITGTGTIMIKGNGRIIYDIEYQMNGQNIDVKPYGTWYIENTNQIHQNLTIESYGTKQTKNTYEVIIEINEDIMVSVDEEGKKSTLTRIK